jgi:malate synthase
MVNPSLTGEVSGLVSFSDRPRCLSETPALMGKPRPAGARAQQLTRIAMTDRVERAGLKVAPELVEFVETEALPGTGVAARATARFWPARDALQAQIDQWHVRRRDAAARPRGLQGVPRGDRLPPARGRRTSRSTRQRRPRDRRRPRAAAGRADHQRPLCAQRRERALGLALRRALRHRRHGQPAPAGRLRRGRGARVIARAKVFLDEAFPVDGGSHADARRYHVSGGRLLVDDRAR